MRICRWVFHRNRLKLPTSVGGLTYSYDLDDGSNVVDISAEVDPTSGYAEYGGHRSESVTINFEGFDGYDCGQHDSEHIQEHIGWWIPPGYSHYAPGSSIRLPLVEKVGWGALAAWPHCEMTAHSAPIQRTVAYYMTLCDVRSRNFVRDSVYNTWVVYLDEGDYACAASHLLSPYGNADSDGQFPLVPKSHLGTQ